MVGVKFHYFNDIVFSKCFHTYRKISQISKISNNDLFVKILIFAVLRFILNE